MTHSDNPTGKSVTSRPSALATSVNDWMNLGRRLFQTVMGLWKPVADFPQRLIAGLLARPALPPIEVVTADFRPRDNDDDLNAKAFQILGELGPNKVSFVVVSRQLPNGRASEIVVPLPLHIMRREHFQHAQDVTRDQILPLLTETGAWVQAQIEKAEVSRS